MILYVPIILSVCINKTRFFDMDCSNVYHFYNTIPNLYIFLIFNFKRYFIEINRYNIELVLEKWYDELVKGLTFL